MLMLARQCGNLALKFIFIKLLIFLYLLRNFKCFWSKRSKKNLLNEYPVNNPVNIQLISIECPVNIQCI